MQEERKKGEKDLLLRRWDKIVKSGEERGSKIWGDREKSTEMGATEPD